jgi:hypothetical protein
MTVDDAPRKLWDGYWPAHDKIWASDAPKLTKLVGLCILRHVSNTKRPGHSWPSYPRLAELCSISESTVSTHANACVDRGWFEVVEGGTGRVTSVYRVTVLEPRDKPPEDDFAAFIRARKAAEGTGNHNPGYQLPVPRDTGNATLGTGSRGAGYQELVPEEHIEELTEELNEEHSTRARARDAMQERFAKSWKAEKVTFPDGSQIWDEEYC